MEQLIKSFPSPEYERIIGLGCKATTDAIGVRRQTEAVDTDPLTSLKNNTMSRSDGPEKLFSLRNMFVLLMSGTLK